MTKQADYAKVFSTEQAAMIRADAKNRACRRSNNYRDVFVVLQDPDAFWWVMDLSSAIDMGQGYTFTE